MSFISCLSFTVDATPGPYGFAEEIRLPDDSWSGVTRRPYVPFVFNYTDNGREPRFRLSGCWLCVEFSSSAEIYVVFEDQNQVVISDPVFLSFGMTVYTDAQYMRVVGVVRSGHFRIAHGSSDIAMCSDSSAVPPESRTMTLDYSGIGSWLAYQSPDGDPSYGLVRVSPVECGISGNASSARFLGPAATTYNATHYEFLSYGVATLRRDPELEGTVTSGIYVKEFSPVICVIVGGANSTTAVPLQYNAPQFLAVYYKLTAAGVTAAALPPERKISTPITRLYNRSNSPYSVA